MNLEIPPEIEDRYEGEWIAWDPETCEVVAHSVDMDEVAKQVRAVGKAGKGMYYHHIHILPPDVLMIGGGFTEIRA